MMLQFLFSDWISALLGIYVGEITRFIFNWFSDLSSILCPQTY